MPVAPIYGKRGGRPMSYSAWDIADEPSQRSMRRPMVRPGGMGQRSPYGVGAPAGRMSGDGAGAMSAYSQGPSAPPQTGSSYVNSLVSRMPGFGAAPKTPAVFDPDDPLRGAPNLQDPIRNWLAQGGREGVFNPDYLTERTRMRASRNADAGRERTRMLSSLVGRDPMSYRGDMIRADMAANQGMVGAMNEAEMADATQYRDMILNFLNRERYGVEAPGEEANIGRRFEEEQRGGLGGFLGSAVGQGLGSWLSPGGLFRGRGGQTRAGG